jgi:hypothetical protein
MHYALLAAMEDHDPERSRKAMQDDINWGTEALDRLRSDWATQNFATASRKSARGAKDSVDIND